MIFKNLVRRSFERCQSIACNALKKRQCKNIYNTNYVVDELFESHFSRSEIGLETSMIVSHFAVQLIYYKCQKIKFFWVVHILILQTG